MGENDSWAPNAAPQASTAPPGPPPPPPGSWAPPTAPSWMPPPLADLAPEAPATGGGRKAIIGGAAAVLLLGGVTTAAVLATRSNDGPPTSISAAAVRRSSAILTGPSTSRLTIGLGGQGSLTSTIRSNPAAKRFAMDESVGGLGQDVTISVVQVGSDVWMKMPPQLAAVFGATGTTPWLHVAATGPTAQAVTAQSSQVAGYLAGVLATPTPLGKDVVGTTPVSTFTVQLDPSKLSIAPAGSQAAAAVSAVPPTTAVVGFDAAGKLRLMSYALTVGEQTITSKVEVLSIGDPGAIDAPPASDVSEAPAGLLDKLLGAAGLGTK